jgi:hypothetical protein
LLLIESKTPVDTRKFGASLIVAQRIENARRNMDIELFLNVKEESANEWMQLPTLLPYDIKVCSF